jgi:glycosyltransferase involved in cell wall biosynthesis
MESKNKIPASVFILTKNSATTLRRTLESVKDFGDIAICDGGSRDETLEIAREYDARIFTQPEDCISSGSISDFSCVRNECMAHTAFTWVFYIDSDEVVSKVLAEEIRRVASEPAPLFLAYRIPSRIRIKENPDRDIKYSSSYPGYQIRLFNKTIGAKFYKQVHERIQFDTERFSVGTLLGPWFYFVKRDGSDYESDFPLYIRLELERYRDVSLRIRTRGVIRAVVTALKIFIKSLGQYFFHGFRNSLPPRIEYLRIKYQLLFAWGIIWNINRR